MLNYFNTVTIKKISSIILIALFACNNNNYELIILKDSIQKDFVEAALGRTNHQVIYNGNYFKMDYPNGDIPKQYGVCTDVIIRSYRKINIDLQKLLHEDIKQNFSEYPIKKHWPQQFKADSNIDHRRVPNLEFFFKKYGKSLPISKNKNDYKPGDIITWNLKGSSPWHIGIVTNQISSKTRNPLIVHNIGKGPIIDDVIFKFPIRGHYRFFPKN